MNLTLRIWRQQSAKAPGSFVTYQVKDVTRDMSFLEMLDSLKNRVQIAEPQLPAEVRNIGVTTQKQSPGILMVIGLSSKSKTYSSLYLSNYAYTQIEDSLKRIDGVGNVTVSGAQPYSMRVWLNPDLMYSRGLTADDVVNAIQAQNIQVAPGDIGGEPAHPRTELQLTLNTKGRLVTPDEFARIILKRGSNGQLVYLGECREA